MVRFVTVTGLMVILMAPAAVAQILKYEKPNLTEDNLRPSSPRIAGSPIDYILITPGGDYSLHFDRQVRRIAIDDPSLIEAVLATRGDGAIATSSIVVLKAKAMGQTKVLIQGEIESGAQNANLLFYARVAVGYRQVIITPPAAEKGANAGGAAPRGFTRLLYDCTPTCIPTPGLEPKAPDYIIEQRVTGGPAPALPPQLPGR
jgi:hypothetical protein